MRTARWLLLWLALWLASSGSLQAASSGQGEVAPTQETRQSSTVRSVYFPFLAIGHGVLLVLEYGVAYPVYYVFKPVIDFIYSSPEDPADFPTSRR